MSRLLLKDVRVSAPLVAAIVLAYVVMGVTAVRNDEAFFWLTVVLAVGLWMIVPILEWQSGADRFLCSLPVDRATSVRARGVWALAANVAAGGLWVASGHLWQALASGPEWGPPATPMWTSADGLLAFGLVTIVLAALFLPCYFRFGIGKGGAIFGALAVVPLAVIGGLTTLGVTAPPASQGRLGGVPPLPATAIRQAIGRLRDSLGTPASLVLLGGCAAVALWASVRLAIRYHEQREF
jgi:hypothetical protein